MAEFSDTLKLISIEDEARLSLKIKDSLAALRKSYPDCRLRCYDFDQDVILAMDLPINRPNRAITFKKIEPVLIKLDKKNYPFLPPKVFTDRMDFPAENTPHINPVIEGQPYSICLFRGDAADWFAQHTIIDLVERLRTWMNDAAAGNLNKPEDDFEFTRVDHYRHGMFFPEKDVIEKIREQWNNNNGSNGIILSNFLTGKDDEPQNPSTMRHVWLIDLLNKPLSDITKQEIILKENQIAGFILFAEEQKVDPRYITKLPSNVEELIAWASDRHIDLKTHLDDFCNSSLKQNAVLPLAFAIRRPRKVINHLSDLEFISFMIFPSLIGGEFNILPNSVVQSAALIRRNSIALAKFLSGYTEECVYEDMHYIGLGAVGSKVALHFARAGYIPTSLIDPDHSLPHNNIRNGLINFSGVKKIDKLEEDIKFLYPLDDEAVRGIVKYPDSLINVINNNPTIFSGSKSLIVDSTGSYGVEHLLIHQLKPAGARYSRVESADRGNLGFLRIEGINRNPRMDDLMIEVYRSAIDNETLSGWLNDNKQARASHSVLDEIYLGLNCSSDTLIMPDDKVSIHASSASVGLRSIIHEKSSYGYLNITSLSDFREMQMITEVKEIKPVHIVKCDNQPEWQLRFRNSLYEELIKELNDNRPNETGGIFIGRIDSANKIIHVTDIISAPQGSQMSPYMFTRGGSEALKQQVKNIRIKTGEMLDYVGEWHTHPSGSAKLSATDQHAITEIRKVLDPVKYPTCVTIINGSKIHPYIFTKYE